MFKNVGIRQEGKVMSNVIKALVLVFAVLAIGAVATVSREEFRALERRVEILENAVVRLQGRRGTAGSKAIWTLTDYADAVLKAEADSKLAELRETLQGATIRGVATVQKVTPGLGRGGKRLYTVYASAETTAGTLEIRLLTADSEAYKYRGSGDAVPTRCEFVGAVEQIDAKNARELTIRCRSLRRL